MSKGFASNYRIVVLAIGTFAAFAGIGTRLIYLQVTGRAALLGSIQKARREDFPTYARRGNILDSKGVLLAASRSLIVLGVDPSDLKPADRSKWPALARLIGRPLPEVETILTTRVRPAVAAPVASGPRPNLVFNLPASDEDEGLGDPDGSGARPIRWAKLSDEITESAYADIAKLNIHGVYGTTVYRRTYPHHELASHLIGFVNRQQQPAAGLERYLNFYLRGIDGWVESEKDGRRQELAQFRTREVLPSDGYDVVLSIDATVQHLVEQELDYIAGKFHPLKASIIVSDPRTGFILAMGNYPTFDPNNYSRLRKDEQGWMQNAAVDQQYEPGSVFKIVAASGALNEGLVSPQTTFDCTLQKIDYNGRVRNLPREDASDHFTRPLSVAEIIAKSSNKGAAQLAMRMGDQKFYGYARAFGFGQLCGFPVGGEIRGMMASPDKWDGLTITRMPMGQSVAATVLQMHQAMSVIASGGLMLRPQLVREIRDARGNSLFRFGPAEVRRVISAQTARTMAGLLWGVVNSGKEGGTAPQAAIEGFDVVGKTGTAQKVKTDGRGYMDRHHVSSFIGFLPASNPQLDITVVVDDADAHTPGGIGYGNVVAAPSFRNLALKLIPYLDIRPARPDVSRTTLALEGGRR